MLFASGHTVYAEQTSQPPVQILELPLVDYPFNWTDGYTAPSMQQSLHITKGFYQYGHYKLEQAYADQRSAQLLSIIAFDVLSSWLPLGDAWLHEEWHRAVMSNRGIDSFNEVYEFPLFAETISVKHVKDEDLARLKAEHPADMVRLHAAGIEAQYELNLAIEKDHFYYQTTGFDTLLLWLNHINNIGYLQACASNESNIITEDILQGEDEDISERDFTGLDCDAWVYDLFRPTEPYAARGIHPSGVGIRRYIKYDDLTPEEQRYLKTNRNLSLLNLADPFLFLRDSFTAINPFNDRPFQWNTTLRHHLTSFGYSIDANLFIKQEAVNAMLILHNYFNRSHYFPGLELALYRLPVNIQGWSMPLSARMALWLQPRQQQFHTAESTSGGLASLKLHLPLDDKLEAFIELETKGAGWVAGNVYLEQNTSLRLGLAAHIF